MNLITADFNWISLVVLVIAGVIGMVKSKSSKPRQKPVFPFPDFEPYPAEEEESYTCSEEQEEIKKDWRQSELAGDYYRKEETMPITDSPVYATPEEEEEYRPQLDLRQAIISSEILKRPEF